MRLRRTFNGKVYDLMSWYPSKKEARGKAKELRQQGRLVRVVKALLDRRYAVYGVYWRRK